MTYAYPTNTTNIMSLAIWMNTVTDGWFWSIILIGLFAILWFSTKQYGNERSLAFSSFITAIAAILLGLMELITQWVVVLVMIIASGSVIILRNINNKEF